MYREGRFWIPAFAKEDWEQIEAQLTERLLAPYRAAHLAMVEVGQIVRGAR